MGWVEETVNSIRSIQIRQLLSQAVSLGMIVCADHMEGVDVHYWERIPRRRPRRKHGAWFQESDILFLHMSKDPIRAGEIVVFNIDGHEIPIVHHVIKVHERQDTGEVDVLAKGDNNSRDDRLLYAEGQLWLQRQHIMGRAVGNEKCILTQVIYTANSLIRGWVTIIMTEKPIIKYILIGALGLLVRTEEPPNAALISCCACWMQTLSILTSQS